MKAPLIYMEKVAIGPLALLRGWSERLKDISAGKAEYHGVKTAAAKVVDYYDPQRNEIDSMKLWKEFKKHWDIETDDTTKPVGYAFNMLNKSPLMRQVRKETGIKDLMLDEIGNTEGVFHFQRSSPQLASLFAAPKTAAPIIYMKAAGYKEIEALRRKGMHTPKPYMHGGGSNNNTGAQSCPAPAQ